MFWGGVSLVTFLSLRVEASALKQTKAKQKLDSGFRRNDKPKKQSRWMTSPTAVESPAKSMRG
ncbi:MAG: hypothetical protein J0I77_13065 [Rudaea sp.]|uniref:hypothetical protein n=1 Tax=Rudaea sp. TaxID=2136325 RepID=UPI001ACB050D|nr:hypothetical protein [Rudaea sp.]MBN8886647.1 hypothetical protein [Rudaea sp.]